MGTYSLKIVTGNEPTAGTYNNIFIALVGVNGESEKHKMPRHWSCFLPGSVAEFDINVDKDLGEILVVRLSMEQYLKLPIDEWFCQYVHVTCPSGQTYQFPFYQWISDLTAVEVSEGKGIVLTGNTHPVLKQQRKRELEQKREAYRWKVYAEGVPHCIDVENDDVKNLKSNDQFAFMKKITFGYSAYSTGLQVKLKKFLYVTDSWHNLEDIRILSSLRRSQISDIVSEIWKEDTFFGDQYLNGINPLQIRRCFKIPDNFPVNEHMVASSLGASTNLNEELQNGNIFLVDYEILQNMPTNTINGQQQFITAPMCLLWKSPVHQLVPIAIQLSQTPGDDVPIFLPSDLEYDWLLAKIWVRSADFLVHQVANHFLRTHVLAEVFSIATTRQLPTGHPVYKLIIQHLRYTLEINVLARKKLIGPNGLFDQVAALNNSGFLLLMKKSMKNVTYSSLCLPDTIESRGMESIPNYFYRDDGMKIWSAIKSFVSNIVNLYYTSDDMVKEDSELQAWVAEIFKEGFLQNKSSEVPSYLESKASLIKYLTMLIFTCSAQHAAVNNGQNCPHEEERASLKYCCPKPTLDTWMYHYDFKPYPYDIYSWMPNGPSTMRSPPPTTKGATTMEAILKALPDVNITATSMSALWALSNESGDRRCLGTYPDVHFTERTAQEFIKEFQDRLTEISTFIEKRNRTMHVPYCYLHPRLIENSVSI